MRGESKMRWYWIASVIVLLTTSVSADERGANADLVKVGSFLNKTFPKKKWQTGPTRIDTPEIRKAYPGARFYAVKSVPPLPPGAALPKLIEANWEYGTVFGSVEFLDPPPPILTHGWSYPPLPSFTAFKSLPLCGGVP
jgi:hypothetical protein